MQLDEDNYRKAEDALKDVLFMFVDATVQDGDFSELNLGEFEPFDYLWIYGQDGQSIYMSDGESDLLMKGAAIALLSKVADVYFDDECQSANEKDRLENGVMPNFIARNGVMTLPNHYSYLPKIYEAFKNESYIKDSYIQNAFTMAFSDEIKFYEAMREVLEHVIKPCFSVLSEFKS